MKAEALALSTLLALASAACASRPEPGAARYPALPSASRADAGEPVFEPAAQLVALALACRSAELPGANALDDDCNGRIDDGLGDAGTTTDTASPDDALVLALSVPQTAALKLGLRSGTGAPLDLTPVDCSTESAFCTRRLSAAELPHGASRLSVDGSALDAAVPPPSVVLSVQSHGKVTTYVAPAAVGAQEQLLLKLFLP
ncbi:MAG: hypothetical protein JWN04_284 [Myxococcaceae bacterium]|nr:hypothetical protein [Myxococcaceae bacterium]